MSPVFKWTGPLILGGLAIGLLFGFGSGARDPAQQERSVASGPPEEMVTIPGGEFPMGSTGQEGKVGFQIGVDEIPQHTVLLDPFFLDRYEVTNSDYQVFIQATGRATPADPHDPDFYRWQDGAPPAGQEDHPVVYVSWYDAEAYCRWVDKRLPTEAEWEKAARGTDRRAWPWGNQFEPERCGVSETSPLWSTPVGSYPQGISLQGAHDLCGNVAEWTASWYQPYPGNTLDRAAFGEQFKVARGGAWVLPYEPWSRAANRNLAQPSDYQHRSIGFRCARDSESTTLAKKGGG